ncbi:MAG: VanZ family protein [Lachnospiraceae bacterium]|nr:VanZ family protein [Lachnospiraceae bacterium]
MKKLIRSLSVLPAIFMLLLIFGFSAQDGDTSGSLSFRISLALVRICDRVFSLDYTDAELLTNAESIGLFVRKAAHMTEYFLLTLSIYLPLWVLLPKKPENDTSQTETFLKRYLLPTFLLSVLLAALDEFHQSFVPGRCGTPVDVMIDSVGIFIGCMVLVFCHRCIQKKRRRDRASHLCDNPH